MDKRMSPEYVRCGECEVPMHVDGHEKCAAEYCPCREASESQPKGADHE